ncbi:cysteine--tRNA ligase [Mycoplasma sp. 128]|uniref:cysteine--tRNA ligase n=1 Tax=Mycoplasma sp. 3341 TaxID=3447506 RepID=UPI003F656953
MNKENIKKYYLCGPTVYNYVHIGNMRPILTFDLMIRAQRAQGQNIQFLHNITDIDDKIINKAIFENKTETQISEYYTDQYLKMLEVYNIQKPNIIAKVTDHLDIIFDFIKQLINKKSAYQRGVNVYFDVMKNRQNYGEVSGQVVENLEAENNDENKLNSVDFALWKDTNVGIKYDSPFGKGRPGWHTECVAMINQYFGNETIDIHAGGVDLTFPHHENENIQFRALTNNPLAKQWIHFGTVNLNNEKMSKSIGNIVLAKDFLKDWSADTLRMIFLSSAYSKPINITDELLMSNEKMISKIDLSLKKMQLEDESMQIDEVLVKEVIDNVAELNFAPAMKIVHELMKSKNSATLKRVLELLGFNVANVLVSEDDKKMYQDWKQLVENKDYHKADILREVLKERKLI